MSHLLWITFGFLCLGGVISRPKVKKYIRSKRTDFNNLYQLVSTQHNSAFHIYRVCLMIIMQNTYRTIADYLDSRIRRKSKNMYEIMYTLEGRTFVHIVRIRRGPSHILSAHDENNKPCLNTVIKYISPNGKFDNKLLTPEYLGIKKLTINNTQGKSFVFEGDEIICL